MKKIIIMFDEAEKYRKRIEELCRDRWEVLYLSGECSEEEFREHARDAEIIFGDVDPNWLRECRNLKWIQISWAGVGPYMNKDYLQHIALTNASGAYGAVIAEHVMGLLLSLARHIPKYVHHAKNGCWKDCGAEWRIQGKKALILGTGDIGTAVAGRAAAFGMEVTGFCRHMRKPEESFTRMIMAEQLDHAIKEADFICGCLPETPETMHLLDARRLAMTKKDAILVNVGRGSLIDTDSLVRMLMRGHFFGVGLDVTDPEPLPKEHPLWKFHNVIITPHVAGIGFGHHNSAEEAIWKMSLENLERFRNGETLKNLVDYKRGY